jgi:proteasome beta subunit
MEKGLEKNILKTGTITVGIVCKNGVVLAAEKRTSAGEGFILSKKEIKIHKLTDNIAVTTAGNVSDIQMIIKLTKAEIKLKELRTKSKVSVREAANLFGSILYQHARSFSTIFPVIAFVMAGKDAHGFSLYQINFDGSVMKFDDYVTTGAYGSIMGYALLEDEWNTNLTLQQGVDLAVKVVKTSIKRDATTGDGINIVTIDKEGVSEIKEIPLQSK